jgi:hypothetical protein
MHLLNDPEELGQFERLANPIENFSYKAIRKLRIDLFAPPNFSRSSLRERRSSLRERRGPGCKGAWVW